MYKKFVSNLGLSSFTCFFIGLGFIALAIMTIPGARILFDTDVSEAIFYPVLCTGLLVNIGGIITGIISLFQKRHKKYLGIVGVILNILIPIGVITFYTFLGIVLFLIE
jgi:hypothetical protein